MTITILDAAEARRSGGVAARADRPRERRCAVDSASPAVVRSALASVNLRASESSSGGLTFEGVASVTEQAYEMWDWAGPYMEIVSAGAFDQTLARADLDVPLVLGHDQMRRIARTTNGTLTLAPTEVGLGVLAELDPADVDVAYVAPKLRSGLIDEMSFAFRITSGQWSPDYSEYRITGVDIHRGDVSIVGWGANPFTTAGVRADSPDLLRATDDQIRAELERRNPRRGMSFAKLLTL
jgi:HK97 family phage prohead protease